MYVRRVIQPAVFRITFHYHTNISLPKRNTVKSHLYITIARSPLCYTIVENKTLKSPYLSLPQKTRNRKTSIIEQKYIQKFPQSLYHLFNSIGLIELSFVFQVKFARYKVKNNLHMTCINMENAIILLNMIAVCKAG